MMPATAAEWGSEFGIRGLFLFLAFLIAWFVSRRAEFDHGRSTLLPILLGAAFFGWSQYTGHMGFTAVGIDSGWAAQHELARGGLMLSAGAVLSLILILGESYRVARKQRNLEPADRGEPPAKRSFRADTGGWAGPPA